MIMENERLEELNRLRQQEIFRLGRESNSLQLELEEQAMKGRMRTLTELAEQRMRFHQKVNDLEKAHKKEFNTILFNFTQLDSLIHDWIQ